MKIDLLKIVLVINAIMILNIGLGQKNYNKLDHKSLKLLVKNSKLETCYNKLIKRYHAFDTTLSINEYRLLYYGFVLQENYLGDNNKQYSFEMNKLIKEKKIDSLLIVCDKVIKKIPISLIANINKAKALDESGDNKSADKYYKRYELLLKAILSSKYDKYFYADYKTIYLIDQLEVLKKIGKENYSIHETVELNINNIKVKISSYIYENGEVISFNANDRFSRLIKKRIKKNRKGL